MTDHSIVVRQRRGNCMVTLASVPWQALLAAGQHRIADLEQQSAALELSLDELRKIEAPAKHAPALVRSMESTA